jgi:hypothetical protein
MEAIILALVLELSFVHPLEADERGRLNALLSSDGKLRSAFTKYQSTHATIDLIANVSLGALDDDIVRRFPEICDEMLASRIADGVTLDEVLRLLGEHGLEKHIDMIPKQRTLQLVSVNHELRGSEFVYRRYKILNF